MIVRILALAAATLCALPAAALTVAASDCIEGSTFIGNAARSRDNGMTSEAFIARFDGDLELIKALPPAARWFVQDEEDAALLRSAVIEVFAERRAPDAHARAFLSRCRASIGMM